jgi:hypothetical protein
MAEVREAETIQKINPVDVVEYLRSNNWVQQQSPANSSFWIKDEFEVTVPLDREVNDYCIRIGEVLHTVSVAEGRSENLVYDDFLKYIPLWEMKRPYYWSSADWYKPEDHIRHDSAQDFLEGFGKSEPNLNYVVRWDWGYFEQDNDKILRTENKKASFCVTVVQQRKGFLTTHEFPVQKEDEPMLRNWLKERWQTVLHNWNPIV